MYLVGVYLSAYVEWCNERAATLRGWQVIAIELAAFIGLCVILEMAPVLVGLLCLVVIGAPVAIFGYVAQRRKLRARRQAQDQLKQLRRTQNLLNGFRR